MTYDSRMPIAQGGGESIELDFGGDARLMQTPCTFYIRHRAVERHVTSVAQTHIHLPPVVILPAPPSQPANVSPLLTLPSDLLHTSDREL